jgi:hypothetical protein
MHQAAIRSLGLVENRLRKHLPEEKVTYHKEKQKEGLRSQPLQNETSKSSGNEKHRKRRKDARSIVAQARVNKAQHAWKKENYEDDKKRWVCYTLPAGFTECEYPKDLSYRTIRKNTMAHKSPRYGCQIICKQYKYLEEQEQWQCKVWSYTSPAQHGPS